MNDIIYQLNEWKLSRISENNILLKELEEFSGIAKSNNNNNIVYNYNNNDEMQPETNTSNNDDIDKSVRNHTI